MLHLKPTVYNGISYFLALANVKISITIYANYLFIITGNRATWHRNGTNVHWGCKHRTEGPGNQTSETMFFLFFCNVFVILIIPLFGFVTNNT